MQYHNILIRLLREYYLTHLRNIFCDRINGVLIRLLLVSVVPYIGDVIRVIHNKMILISLYLVQNLSLIAWMLFGKEESQLKLYPRYN